MKKVTHFWVVAYNHSTRNEMNPKGQCKIEHNLMPSEVGQEFSKVLHRAPGPYGTYMYGPYIYSFTYKALCLLLFEKKRVLILKIEKKKFSYSPKECNFRK